MHTFYSFLEPPRAQYVVPRGEYTHVSRANFGNDNSRVNARRLRSRVLMLYFFDRRRSFLKLQDMAHGTFLPQAYSFAIFLWDVAKVYPEMIDRQTRLGTGELFVLGDT